MSLALAEPWIEAASRIDWQAASKHLKMLPGRVAVEMLPVPEKVGGLFVPHRGSKHESRKKGLRLGVVLARGRIALPSWVIWPVRLPEPADIVYVNPEDGKKVLGWAYGDYKPQTGPDGLRGEVRFYGLMVPYRASGPAQGVPVAVPCNESILGVLDMPSETKVPFLDNVLVRLDPRLSQSEGGVLIPDTVKERMDSGTVVAVGDWVKEVSPGERIIFERRAIRAVETKDGVEEGFVYEQGIYAVLN